MKTYYIKDSQGGYFKVQAEEYIIRQDNKVLSFYNDSLVNPFVSFRDWTYVTTDGYLDERRRPQ